MSSKGKESSKALKISMVGYLNTVPMVYGLRQSEVAYDLKLEVPSACFSSFQDARVDLALLPVGTLPLLPEARIVTDYCIGCEAAVRTVCLFSPSSIEAVDTIYLDTDSRTSVLLCRVLAEHFWHLTVQFVSKDIGAMDLSQLRANEAVLMIGDKVFEVEHQFAYKYDLGEEWQQFTGMPFVFAVWVARSHVSAEQVEKLNADLAFGIANTHIALQDHQPANKAFDLESYFKNHISYKLNADKKDALQVFLKLIDDLPNPTF